MLTAVCFVVTGGSVCLALALACDPKIAERAASVLLSRAAAVREARLVYRRCRGMAVRLEEK
jgi:hypothetical protein